MAETEQQHIDPTAPHQPPYDYHHSSGYDLRVGNHDMSRYNPVELHSPPHDERDFDDDDENSFDSGDDSDLFDNDIATSNPNDYTKTYNRQRRLHDTQATGSQLPKTNTQQKPKANLAARVDDQIAALARHAGKLKLDDQTAGLKSGSSGLGLERSDRATNEQVLDPRTRMILLQMINRGTVSEIYGCISTGKEANVYHAVQEPLEGAGAPKHLAIKIYKTAILHFKDRSKYVSGEFRFQRGYPKRSNRGMVRLWAEKEFRNLKRMYGAGLPTPEPIYLKSHVLVMGFVGSLTSSGQPVPAPLLRDVEFREQNEENQLEIWRKLYRKALVYMRLMYQTCKLVHADLSEYNLLYDHDQSRLTVIDVSQSVEHDHPRSLDFLRLDIKNITAFFARKGITCLTEPSIFHFISRDKRTLDSEDMHRVLDELQECPIQPDADAEVFRQQYIPQALNEVEVGDKRSGGAIGHNEDHAALQDLLARGSSEKATLDGGKTMQEDMSGGDDSRSTTEKASSPSRSASDMELKDTKESKPPRGHRFEDKATKAQRKSAAKEEKRERRKTKMPKHVKRKLVNHSSRGHKK